MYFHEYKTHPYWERFNNKIQSCLDKLKDSIGELDKSFLELYNTLDSLDYNLELLPHRINKIRIIVQTSIDKLKAHITKGVADNKKEILKSIESIRNKIDLINDTLKLYAFGGLVKISSSQSNIHLLQLTIQGKIIIISSHIRRIMCLLILSRKITLVIKVGEQRSLQEISNGSSGSYELNYQIESSKKIEETKELNKIVQKLECISKSITKLPPLETPSLRSLEELKLDNLDNINKCLQEIQKFSEKLQPLEPTIERLKKLKEQLDEQIKSLLQQCKSETVQSSTFNSQQSTTQNVGGHQASRNSQGYYNYVVTFTKTIVCCNHEIENLLKEVGTEIDGLEKEYENFWKHLEDIKQQLRDLQVIKAVLQALAYIKFLNCSLKYNIFNLDLSEIMEELLKKGETEIQKIINNECCSKYYVYVENMKRFLDMLLPDLANKELSGKHYLQLARHVLYRVNCEVTKLLRFGDNILYLYYNILGIKELQMFQEKMKEIREDLKSLNPFKETLNLYMSTLKSIENKIEKLYDLKDKLPKLSNLSDLSKLQDMPKNLQTLNDLYTSIEKLNLSLTGIVGGEFMQSLLKVVGVAEGVAGGKLSNGGLQEIEKKLSEGVTKNFDKITKTFKEKVKGILSECSSRLSKITVPSVENCFYVDVTTCITHANILIPIINLRSCDKLCQPMETIRTKLKELKDGVPDLATLCQPDEVCKCITGAFSAINLSCHSGEQIIGCFTNCIQALQQKKEELAKKIEEIDKKKQEITVTLNVAKGVLVNIYGSKGPVKFKVECLQLHFTKVTNELVPFLDKVGNVICTLGKEIEHLQSQLETTKKELKLLNDFRCDVEAGIKTMEGNIDKISKCGKEISDKYKAYTSAFTAFNQKLNNLETCLDYRVAQFLRCSLKALQAERVNS